MLVQSHATCIFGMTKIVRSKELQQSWRYVSLGNALNGSRESFKAALSEYLTNILICDDTNIYSTTTGRRDKRAQTEQCEFELDLYDIL